MRVGGRLASRHKFQRPTTFWTSTISLSYSTAITGIQVSQTPNIVAGGYPDLAHWTNGRLTSKPNAFGPQIAVWKKRQAGTLYEHRKTAEAATSSTSIRRLDRLASREGIADSRLDEKSNAWLIV
jgi:hypothetical protein